MRRHWQRLPLLVRQAFPDWRSPLNSDDVRRMALRDEMQSRLVTCIDGHWKLAHGPFAANRIPSARKRDWTLLVQGVDRHDDAVHALLAPFRFLSDARLDDVMISIAGDGGGVGPHLDSYDVFLLQAEGQRRWRIGPGNNGKDKRGSQGKPGTKRSGATSGEPQFVDGLPLKILSNFAPDEEWLLAPGDMLYLPPGWAHEGVAVGPCMTISIGFRAPSRREFLQAWLAECADEPGGTDPRFGDAGASATATPAALPDALVRTLGDWARDWQPQPAAIERFIGRYLTEPHADVWFDDNATHDVAAMAEPPQRLRLDRRSRAAYRGTDLFVNGECFVGAASAALKQLADQRSLHGALLRRAWASPAQRELLDDWLDSGWLHADTAK